MKEIKLFSKGREVETVEKFKYQLKPWFGKGLF